MLRTLAFAVLACLVLCSAAHSQNKPSDKERTVTYYDAVIIGNGGRVDMVLGRFDSYEEAENAGYKWAKEHENDLRLYRVDKINLRVRDVPSPMAKPKPEEAPLTGPKGDPPKVPMGVVEKDNPDSVSGKTVNCKLGSDETNLEFQPDGTAVFSLASEPKKPNSKGTWSQTGSAVSVETDLYRYLGLVKAGKLDGKRVRRGDGGKVETWQATIVPATPKPAPAPRKTQAEYQREIGGNWMKDTLTTCEMAADGTVVIRHTQFGIYQKGTWTVDAATREIKFSLHAPTGARFSPYRAEGTVSEDGKTMKILEGPVQSGQWTTEANPREYKRK